MYVIADPDRRGTSPAQTPIQPRSSKHWVTKTLWMTQRFAKRSHPDQVCSYAPQRSGVRKAYVGSGWSTWGHQVADLCPRDFKGDFLLGNGHRCHPLTLTDTTRGPTTRSPTSVREDGQNHGTYHQVADLCPRGRTEPWDLPPGRRPLSARTGIPRSEADRGRHNLGRHPGYNSELVLRDFRLYGALESYLSPRDL
jgi:hypothetical protein